MSEEEKADMMRDVAEAVRKVTESGGYVVSVSIVTAEGQTVLYVGKEEATE